jgi:hypothetical protein
MGVPIQVLDLLWPKYQKISDLIYNPIDKSLVVLLEITDGRKLYYLILVSILF